VTNSNYGLTAARWVLPLIFLLGYWLTEYLYDDQFEMYLGLTMASVVASVLLMSEYKRLSPQALIVTIILFVFIIGYYFKFYLLSYAILNNWPVIELADIFGFYVFDVMNPSLLLETYEVITYSFIGFAVISIIILRTYQAASIRINRRSSVAHDRRAVFKILITALVLFTITSAVRWYFGLGSTVQEVILPMKIGGITTIVNSQVVPFLMIVALGSAYRCGEARFKSKIAIVFILLGAIQFLLFHSKLHLMLPFLSILIFRMMYGSYALKTKYVYVALLALLVIYPFLNTYRSIAVNTGVSGLSTFSDAMGHSSQVSNRNNIQSTTTIGLLSLVGRVVGLDSLMVIMADRNSYAQLSTLDILSDEESITNILGRRMIGVEGTGIAEGILGGFYYVTANEFGTAILVGIWTAVSLIVVRRLWLMGSVASMNMAAIWIIFCLQTTTGGVRVMNFLWFGFAIAVVYLVVRLCDGKMRRLGIRDSMSRQQTNIQRSQKR